MTFVDDEVDEELANENYTVGLENRKENNFETNMSSLHEEDNDHDDEDLFENDKFAL